MGEKMLGLILEFDAETEAKMEAIQQALLEQGLKGAQTKKIPHHITLGLYAPDRERELVGRIEENREQLHAFNLTFQHIGLFGLKVLFLGPDVNSELLQMHKLLLLEPDPCWCPHATLLIDDEDNLIKALPIVAQHFERIDARAERLCLNEFFPLRPISTIHLL